MARILMAGNEHIDYRADGFTSYTAVTTAYQPSINRFGGLQAAFTQTYSGGRGYFGFFSNSGIVYDFTPQFPSGLSEVFIRFHLAPGYAMNGEKVFMRFLDASNAVTHEIRIQDSSNWNLFSNGYAFLRAYRGDAGLNYVNTGSLYNGRGFNGTTPWLVELHLKIDGTNGEVEWRIDGVNNGGVYRGNTLGTAGQTNFRKLVFSYINISSNNNEWYIDDIAVNDTTGTVNNTWCGDGYILPMDAIRSGSSSQFTNAYGSSVNNFNHINRVIPNGNVFYEAPAYSAGNPSYFVGTNNPGDKDLYKMSRLPVEFMSIKAIGSAALATRNGPLITRAKHLFKPPAQSEIAVPGSGNLLPVSQFDYVRTVLDINPNTGLPFTLAEIQGMESGMQLIA